MDNITTSTEPSIGFGSFDSSINVKWLASSMESLDLSHPLKCSDRLY